MATTLHIALHFYFVFHIRKYQAAFVSLFHSPQKESTDSLVLAWELIWISDRLVFKSICYTFFYILFCWSFYRHNTRIAGTVISSISIFFCTLRACLCRQTHSHTHTKWRRQKKPFQKDVVMQTVFFLLFIFSALVICQLKIGTCNGGRLFPVLGCAVYLLLCCYLNSPILSAVIQNNFKNDNFVAHA